MAQAALPKTIAGEDVRGDGSSQSRKLPATRKGRDKRERIKAVTSDLLKSLSYHELTLERITREVGMPISVFYHYFPSKRELVLELLDEVFRHFKRGVVSSAPFGRYDRGVFTVCHKIISLYADNVGLMRCLAEVEEPEFAKRWRSHLARWRDQMAEGLAEFADSPAPNVVELKAVTHAISGMVESVAYERFVLETDAMCAALPDRDCAAEFLTMLWVRAVFTSNPGNVDPAHFPTLASLHELPTN